MSETNPEEEMVQSGLSLKEASSRKTATVVYVLQALGFIFVITYLIAPVVNYIFRSNAAGTWVDTHFRWQLRTFWFSLLWFFLATMISVTGLPGLILIPILAIWVIYRVVRGWKGLVDGKEMYPSTQVTNL